MDDKNVIENKYEISRIELAISDIAEYNSKGFKVHEIISIIDRDYSIPPTDGRQLIMFVKGLFLAR